MLYLLPLCNRSISCGSVNDGSSTGVGISAAGNRIVLFTKSSIEPATPLSNGFLTIGRDVSLCKLCVDIFYDSFHCVVALCFYFEIVTVCVAFIFSPILSIIIISIYFLQRSNKLNTHPNWVTSIQTP